MGKWAMEDVADFVIVGSGAGGATAAYVLSAAGFSVLILEEGAYLQSKARPKEALKAMSQSMRGFGAQTTDSAVPIPLLQGVCVGGSTAINSGIIWRMPQDVRKLWKDQHGLDELVNENALHRIYERIEKLLGVQSTDSSLWGGNGHKLADAASAMHLKGKAMERNAAQCKGSGRCVQGCPNGARQSMDVSLIPLSIDQGARLFTGARALQVVIKQGRATGVTGKISGAWSAYW
ncbi:MAG: GMC family oxidoreductase N-terminal domain-containing protein [Myxococcales bacterium]|nr:MAG: GMC family oxidoreductase N-terminal domain-containing protein [Myxococcales bacterium]